MPTEERKLQILHYNFRIPYCSHYVRRKPVTTSTVLKKKHRLDQSDMMM